VHTHDESQEKDRLSREEARRTLRRLIPFLSRERGPLTLGILAMLVTTACQLAGPLVVRYVIDHGIQEGARRAIYQGVAVYVAIFLVGTGVGYLQVLVLTRMGLRIVTALKQRIFGHLLSLSTKFHDRTPVGKLIARTESDAEQVKEMFSRNAVEIVKSALQFTGALAVLLVVMPKVALVFVFLVPVLAGATFIFLRVIRRIYREVRRQYSELSGAVTEYVQGVPVVQQFNQKPRASRVIDVRNRAKFRADLKAWTLDYTYWGAFIYFEVLAAAAIIWIGSEAIVDARMKIGDLSLFLLYISLVFMPIMSLGEQLSQVQRALAAADRVFDHLDIAPEVFDRKGARGEVRLERELRFEDVSFSYTDDKLVLEDVSFTVRKGEKVALVGPSGGGKTTLVSLFLRFVDPTAGRITVDGEDVRDFTLEAWRSRIGLVLQEIYLFPGTVLDNLRVLDDSIPEAGVVRAAETVRADSPSAGPTCRSASDSCSRSRAPWRSTPKS
jgi:ATP-binding cassette subfamily B protein